jgi:site-specific recombinase
MDERTMRELRDWWRRADGEAQEAYDEARLEKALQMFRMLRQMRQRERRVALAAWLIVLAVFVCGVVLGLLLGAR